MASSSSKSDDEQSLVSSSDSQDHTKCVRSGSPKCAPQLLLTVDGMPKENQTERRSTSRLFSQRFSEVQIPQFVISRLQAKAAGQSRRCSHPEAFEFDEKAAMDFSLTKGRILKGAKELKDVLKEQQHLRPSAKVRLHSPDTRLHLGAYMSQPWFHNDMSREDAVALLNSYGCKEGSFLIRVSDRLPGCFVLSMAHTGSVLHYPISLLKNDKGLTLLTLDGGRTKFKDLFQLIDFYELNCGHLPNVLQPTFVDFRRELCSKPNDASSSN